MRLRALPASLATAALAALISAAALADPSAGVPAQGASTPAAPADDGKPKDLLGNMVVVASAARALPKIGVVPSLSAELEDVTLRSVVRRDLDLCGEFEVMDESAAPSGLYLSDSPVDTKAWANKGAEAVVRVTARREGDKIELTGQAYLVKSGSSPVLEKKTTVLAADLRTGAHRMADALIGALTGHKGAFASRLTFASGTGKIRRVYVIDADGHAARAVSPEDETALTPVFGKDQEIFYAASVKNGEYRIKSEKGSDRPLSVKGSVYGITFDKDRGKVAVSVGSGAFIRLLAGPDLDHLTPASDRPFAMEPTFTPGGKLAFVALGTNGQRIHG
jgi:TolB protein